MRTATASTLVRDIGRVAGELALRNDRIVLGARQFGGRVPLRSRIGNDVTRLVFRVATGLQLTDTQTGLRGYPASLLGWLGSIKGQRFEYELDVLLAARRAGVPFHEVPIETIYLADNESSHFDPVLDSIRVYVPFVKFCAASLVAFAVDTAAFFVLLATTSSLATAVVGARLVSGTVNFTANHRIVFAQRRSPFRSAGRYAALALALMIANYGLIRSLVDVGVPLVAAKLVTEMTLFVLSYKVQQRFVFGPVASADGDPHEAAAFAAQLGAREREQLQ